MAEKQKEVHETGIAHLRNPLMRLVTVVVVRLKMRQKLSAISCSPVFYAFEENPAKYRRLINTIYIRRRRKSRPRTHSNSCVRWKLLIRILTRVIQLCNRERCSPRNMGCRTSTNHHVDPDTYIRLRINTILCICEMVHAEFRRQYK